MGAIVNVKKLDNLTLNVKDFGAKGNWNATAQVGADDTAAIQAAIDAFAAMPTKRGGGARVLFFPAGNYLITSIKIPASLSFGIDFVGEGRNASTIWADYTDANPAIDSEVELVSFKDIGLLGTKEVTGYDIAKFKAVFYRGKLPSGRQDVDVSFINCYFGFSQDFVQAYGRGVVINGGTAVYATNLINIVCDPGAVWSTGNNTFDTGMRHYTIEGMRADVLSRVITISGSGAQKDHIHSIQIVGNDFAVCDRLIDGTDATIRGALIDGNTSLDSFAGGVVTVKSLTNLTDSNNIWRNTHSEVANPSSATDCIQWVYKTTGAIAGLTIQGTTASNLSFGVISAGAASTNVKVLGCNFPQFTTFAEGNANHWVFFSGSNCNGLIISNNTFTTNTISGTYQLYDATVQTSQRTRVSGNVAPFTWADSRLRWSPTVKVNGVNSATAPSSAQGRYTVDDNYVYGEFMIVINPVETTGNLGITLPSVTPIAENAAITSSYSGGGSINRLTGFSLAGSVAAPIQVNPATLEAEMYSETGLVRSRLTAANKSGIISIFGTFKYRYQ